MEKQGRAIWFYFKTCRYLAVFCRLSREAPRDLRGGRFSKNLDKISAKHQPVLPQCFGDAVQAVVSQGTLHEQRTESCLCWHQVPDLPSPPCACI